MNLLKYELDAVIYRIKYTFHRKTRVMVIYL